MVPREHRIEVLEAILPNGVGRAGGVDRPKKGSVDLEEDFADFAELIELFEGVWGIAASADAIDAGGGIEVEEEDEVGLGGEAFVFGEDPLGVEAAGALVGGGGKVIAIEQDDVATGEGGTNDGGDMFGAIFEKEVQFLSKGEAAFGHALAEFHPPRPAGGFTAHD